MRHKIITAIIAALLIISVFPFIFTREYGDTAEFRKFVNERAVCDSVSRKEQSGNYTYVLEKGVLSFFDEKGKEIWHSDKYWFVDDFKLFDVDGDKKTDCLFTLWKSYSYYKNSNKVIDASVKNHLFLYTIDNGYAKALWASSNLPRPIYSFSITNGDSNSVATGAVLKTVEGEYSQVYTASTGKEEFIYTWQGWGFVPYVS